MLLRPILLGIAALAAGSSAQTSSASSTFSTVTATSSSAATTHTIAVGANGFKFEPNEITDAQVGDIIEWRFYPTGHSVVRAGFMQPCIPYEDTEVNRIGFFSGVENVDVVSNNLPTFQVRVNDTIEPIFFYCSAPGSCLDQHMIGVINPNTTWTLAVQEAYLLNATLELDPGQPFPSETAAPSSTPTATGSASSSHHSSGSHLSAGAIAGIAIGAAAVVVLAGGLIYLCGRRGGLDKAYRHSRTTFPPPMVEAKFTPKSPGQETFSTTHYSVAPNNDPYHQGAPSPPIQSHYTGSGTGSPPPMTPGSHTGYAPYPSPGHQVLSPMTGADGSTIDSHGYYGLQPSSPPPPHIPQQPPVELPTSSDPGNSPLPNYPGGHFSWAQGTESGYRPSGKQ